jgi:hypothetical protein
VRIPVSGLSSDPHRPAPPESTGWSFRRHHERTNSKLAEIDTLLTRIERLSQELRMDPDGHVRRSTTELRSAFDGRRAIEPAVARVRNGIVMLRTGNRDGSRREFQRRAHGVDHLEEVFDRQLLPTLRRIGFDV